MSIIVWQSIIVLMPTKNASTTKENALRQEGYLFVAGIDEVGRGSLAGPLVAGVVILPNNYRLKLYDSKLLNHRARVGLVVQIKTAAVGFGLGWVNNNEIDNNGLAWALHEAYIRALIDMNMPVSKVLLDGNVDYLADYDICETCVKGDQKITCVAAASILVKVARDEYMIGLSNKYPEYGYETNVGYGTVSHREAIAEHGMSDLHRASFSSKILT